MFVDSHCHLAFPELRARLPAIRLAMQHAGVDRALCICTTLEEFDSVHQLALQHDNFWATVGVHPDNETDAQGLALQEPDVATLVAWAQRPRVIGLGETGLDYFRPNGRSWDDMAWQRERFRVHIRAAVEVKKPLIIHTRNASADTMSILREEAATQAGGVFHCFTESLAVARAALDLGFYISFSGILTFKNAVDLREVARFVPLERCLIETDSPYLAPAPYRGKSNDPSLLPHVAEQLAQVKNCTIEKIAEHTSRNFEDLFFRFNFSSLTSMKSV
jgi:TatD DNase family protein